MRTNNNQASQNYLYEDWTGDMLDVCYQIVTCYRFKGSSLIVLLHRDSRLTSLMIIFLMNYNENIIIPETNKNLNTPLSCRKLLKVLGC